MQFGNRMIAPQNLASLAEAQRPPPLTRIDFPEAPRLKRIRFMSQLLDNWLRLPGGFRIGLDPIIGLLPGIGDLLGTLLSLILVYDAARLGIPKRVLLQMLGNVLLEALVGDIPLLGDIFDAVWKANIRNLRLVERHYYPTMPERSAAVVWGSIGIFVVALLAIVIGINLLLLLLLLRLLGF
jgi:hypothetical protein